MRKAALDEGLAPLGITDVNCAPQKYVRRYICAGGGSFVGKEREGGREMGECESVRGFAPKRRGASLLFARPHQMA
jgi:hypothetical protein